MTTREYSGKGQGRGLIVVVAWALLVSLFAPTAGAATDSGEATLVEVIVREAQPSTSVAESLVATLGGRVGEALPVIGGFTAFVPAGAMDLLNASEAVAAATSNATLTLQAAGWEDASTLNGYDPATHPGSLREVVNHTGARHVWQSGYTGAGIDVALIDSGVAPVNGLTTPGKVVNGADLSFESQFDNLRYLDTFGHGTHLAGIIAGVDDAVDQNNLWGESGNHFVGVAPGARIVSVKVADAHGVTDVSQVIAAIDWVVQHRNDGDLNIRVLNLSFGTDGTQDYVLDPLAYAVEQAWHSGIVVVVSAGNDGNGAALRNPAYDPFVIAVGALDPNGTHNPTDDTVTDFTNCGTSARHVDVVAPGRSITSLRAPGSYADVENPGAVVAERLFVGSGTSQAAAVISGAAALILDENPDLSPDEVKMALTSTATEVAGSSTLCQGAGTIDVYAATKVKRLAGAAQKHEFSLGTGTLEAARGSDHLTAEGVVLEGEQDIMGNAWTPWCAVSQKGKKTVLDCAKTLWDGGTWNGGSWSGGSWSGASWSGASWSGASWSGASWSGASWSGASWSGGSWSGASWSGGSWSGGSWSGGSWSGGSWSGGSWSGSAWLSGAAFGLSWD